MALVTKHVKKMVTSILVWLLIGFMGGFMLDGYAEISTIVLIADPKVLAVRIIDNHEPMVDLAQQQEIAYGPSPEIPNNTDYLKLRKTAYEKLIQAQKLLPKGLHFCIYEGYRSINLQKMLFDNRFTKVKQHHPTWSDAQIFTETTKWVAPIINQDGSQNIPPHSTGAAMDVYLINDKREAIDMGIHPKDWMTDNDGSVSLTSSKVISVEAQKNRKIMCDALSKVGFVNYPTEYWHWSYGDRYWTYNKHEPQAIYGKYKE